MLQLEIRRCPPALLVRLKQDLRDYVTELSADGLKTIQWSHVQFHEAATERYLLQRDRVSVTLVVVLKSHILIINILI